MKRIILYSKPGCHLCEGLQEKLEQITSISFNLEIRDITTREDWFAAYQYEIPVLFLSNHRDTENAEELQPIPRPSPRANVRQLEQLLLKYIPNTEKNHAE
ncbi:glutaredoxin family protein [Sphaerospermopsis kisseleviana CS-549]|uniref:Glutaredoxin family protein n=1 Tax=Sphaerospermopsis kisseleviana CS-549 TaxID=3021783 RepID=A0ABT4ZW82_9CYAN|nr:glutaredoxin family protein [Sphaerospermopsis kisseleviana]MDB9443676.1 glutaredoxin family protein [Sphaerospermopsis kisseleviana CS-549]BAZ79511.1 glutaredoxin 2 [Sphaerospermopsis kisseleviana NIES-73]